MGIPQLWKCSIYHRKIASCFSGPCIFKYSYTGIAIYLHADSKGESTQQVHPVIWDRILFWCPPPRMMAALLYYWTIPLKLCASQASTCATAFHSQSFAVKWAVLVCNKITVTLWLYFNRHWQYIHQSRILYLSWKALVLLPGLEQSNSIKYLHSKWEYVFVVFRCTEVLKAVIFW